VTNTTLPHQPILEYNSYLGQRLWYCS